MKKLIGSERSKLFLLMAVTIGGALEWYEIGLFISWPLILGKSNLYEDTFADSFNTAVILLIAFLSLVSGGTRALGAWYFGKVGDQQGRRKAFSQSVLLSALPSLFLPVISFFIPYSEWISYSAIVFAVAKIFQGIPAGGEFPGAICYLAETKKIYQDAPLWVSRRYLCSFTILGPQMGLMFSMIMCLVLKNTLSQRFLMHFWSYFFLSSGLLGIGGFIMRKALHETYSFNSLHHKIDLHPIKTVFSKYFSRLIFGLSLSIFETVSFIVINLAPLFYLKTPYSLTGDSVLYLSILSTILRSIFLILISRLLVRYIHFPWIKLSVWGMIFFSTVLYFSLLQESLLISTIVMVTILFFYSIQAAILPSLLAELFPTRLRYTGIAFSFNVCDAILLTLISSICYILISNDSEYFILLITLSGVLYLFNFKSKLWGKVFHN